MVKKSSMEERREKLEKQMEELALETRTSNTELRTELRDLMEELRSQRKRRRKRDGSDSTVYDDADEEEESSDGTETTGEARPKPRHRYRGRKLEIPVFEGEEAYRWLVKVERYFKINGVEEEEMLEAVVIALDGRALNWYQWWEDQHPDPSWDEFKQAVIRRFQPSLVRNPLGPILNVKQTGSIMEYREQFEMLMAPLKRGERVMLESIFLNGLREEIQAELKLHNTRGLNAMMDRALLIEERNKALKEENARKTESSKWRPGYSVSGQEAGRSRTFVPKPKIEAGGSTGGVVEGKATVNMGEKKPPMRKNLSQDELRELSRKGLCFKCGERWGRDHVCKMKHYRVELIDEEEEEEGEEEVPVEEEEVVVESTEAFKTLLLSLRSKQGLTSNKSFKVWGVINGRRVLILIDSGATSNFICHLLVKELGLALEETSEYTIEVGNGEKVVQKGVCAGLRVVVQDIAFTQNFYLMNLAGT